MSDIKTIRKQSASDLWAAVEQAAPELAVAVRNAPAVPRFKYRDYDGFREWLIVEFALNTPTRLVREKLRNIQDDQMQDGADTVWPTLSKSQLDAARRDLGDEWRPLRHDIEQRIADVGIANKVSRLLAYQQHMEEVADRMWDERNTRTGELYLLKEYRDTLRAVAEEMGDLGKPADDEKEGLVDIAKELIGIIKVQGSGLQDNGSIDMEFNYDTGTYERED